MKIFFSVQFDHELSHVRENKGKNARSGRDNESMIMHERAATRMKIVNNNFVFSFKI